MSIDYHQKLLPNETYHLFSRAVGDETLFRRKENYDYFLKRLSDHTSGVADVYAYTLLPNHFHLLVRIKSTENIRKVFEDVKKTSFDPVEHDLSDFIMERYSNWLNGYTKAINKMYSRKGALFMDYMKRSIVKLDKDFLSFVFYIHKNAVHHGLVNSIGKWSHDSYLSLLSELPTALLREELMNYFGGVESFKTFHSQKIELKKLDILDL